MNCYHTGTCVFPALPFGTAPGYDRFTALTVPAFHVILPSARGVAANVLDVCLGSGLPASIGACRTLAVFVDESILIKKNAPSKTLDAFFWRFGPDLNW